MYYIVNTIYYYCSFGEFCFVLDRGYYPLVLKEDKSSTLYGFYLLIRSRSASLDTLLSALDTLLSAGNILIATQLPSDCLWLCYYPLLVAISYCCTLKVFNQPIQRTKYSYNIFLMQ